MKVSRRFHECLSYKENFRNKIDNEYGTIILNKNLIVYYL